MATQESNVTVSVSTMKDMLIEVLKEARKAPELTEAELAELESAQSMRKERAELELARMETRRQEQEYCTHMRQGIYAGTTSAVYVENGNYMICQQCQKIVRPDQEPALFRRLQGASGTSNF